MSTLENKIQWWSYKNSFFGVKIFKVPDGKERNMGYYALYEKRRAFESEEEVESYLVENYHRNNEDKKSQKLMGAIGSLMASWAVNMAEKTVELIKTFAIIIGGLMGFIFIPLIAYRRWILNHSIEKLIDKRESLK